MAWIVAALTALLAVADGLVTAAYRPLLSEAAVAVHGFPFVDAASVGSAVMGALIISRYARHPIGWLLCMTGLTAAISLLTEAYSVWVLTAGGPGSPAIGAISGWISFLLGGQLSLAILAILFLIAPDGRFLSSRWRSAAVLTLVGLGLHTIGVMTMSPTRFDPDEPDAGPLSSLLISVGLLLILIGLIAAIVSLVRRLRASAGEQRQQLRLIAASALFLLAGFLCLAVVQLLNGGKQTWAAGLPLFIAYLCLPVFFAVAVLRYRMYDIEVIVNRAVVLVLGTAFAAIGYTGLVVTVAAVVNTQTSGFWLSLLATALVALAFQPLRRSVVRLANRLAYGSRAAPYEALFDFSHRLAETPSPDTLLPAVAEAAGLAVSARRSTATLRLDGSAGISRHWPAGGPEVPPDHSVIVQDRGDVLGGIDVTLRKGHRLRAADERLLQDLAEQTALAFRNAAMEAELAEHVVGLDRTTRALEASRRRIIAADDAARRQLEAAISQQVMPYLDAMPAQLGRMSAETSPSVAAAGLDQMVSRTNQALERLRELTRGVFPTQLARAGLAPALRSLLARSGRTTTVQIDASAERRFPPRVETAVYFSCAEALRVGTGPIHIDLSAPEAGLLTCIRGFARDEVDMQAIVDRVEAVGGSLTEVGADVVSISLPVGQDAI